MDRLLHPPLATGSRAPGRLQTPPQALGLVLLPRPLPWRSDAQQQRLLHALHGRRLATLTLAARHTAGMALGWLNSQPDLARLPLGLWARGAGTRQALVLAAQHPARLGAVVALNAELDTSDPLLSQVNAATLLLVLCLDATRAAEQQPAMKALRCEKRLEWVPLPAQPSGDGAFDAVVQIAGDWLLRHLAGRRML